MVLTGKNEPNHAIALTNLIVEPIELDKLHGLLRLCGQGSGLGEGSRDR